jgi:Dullard-like phosphatase family protein
MEEKKLLILPDKNIPKNQLINNNGTNNPKYSEQNKNLNESLRTTATSSVSINSKKIHKKAYQIPKPKYINAKNTENLMKMPNKMTNIIYTKSKISKNILHQTNINDKNKSSGRSMSHLSRDQEPNILKNKESNNNIYPINGSKEQQSQKHGIEQNNQQLYTKNKFKFEKKSNLTNDFVDKDLKNDLNYFSHNEEDYNIPNSILDKDNKLKGNIFPKRINQGNNYSPKKDFNGYYSENEQRKERSSILNIDEILRIEEKLSAVISSMKNNMTCEEECFDWFNTSYNTSLCKNIETYFFKDEYVQIVQKAMKLNIFSLMVCYDISYNEEIFEEIKGKLCEIMEYNHFVFILIAKYLENKIIENNLWVQKLKILINKYDNSIKSGQKIIKEIFNITNILKKLISEILNFYQNQDFISIYISLDSLTSDALYNIYREKIHRILNQNGSVLASSIYLKNNKKNDVIKAPYLGKKSDKPYTLVLDLDETLINFKTLLNDEGRGTIRLRPFLYDFLDKIKKYYELVIFTAATKEYANPIIDAIEQDKKYFEYRLYRDHTILIDMDFVKDLSKLGRDLSKVIIVDNMEQNYKLQKSNGIAIRPFWGKDSDDSALSDLSEILIKIAERKLDVRTGLKLYKDDILSKVTTNISRRAQLK